MRTAMTMCFTSYREQARRSRKGISAGSRDGELYRQGGRLLNGKRLDAPVVRTLIFLAGMRSSAGTDP